MGESPMTSTPAGTVTVYTNAGTAIFTDPIDAAIAIDDALFAADGLEWEASDEATRNTVYAALPDLSHRRAEEHEITPAREAEQRAAGPQHIDYPHDPGTLYDCPACEGPCPD